MSKVPEQCKVCANFDNEEFLCKIYEQLPGEYGREDIVDCSAFYESTHDSENDLKLLLQYIDEDPDSQIEQGLSTVVDRILTGYEVKYKVLIVGIARRKIKSIIKMVDIVDSVLDKLGSTESIEGMNNSQAIRLLSELNHSMNNDLTFIMKLVNPDTKLQDLQMWIDARSVVNVNNGSSPATDMKAEEILKVSGASRDKIREAFDALIYQISIDDLVEVRDISDRGDDYEG